MKNLAALEIFVTVAKLKNFSRAADQLGVTKSTVSRQVHALEKDLGVTLIKRDPRHFSLTDEGVVFLKRADTIMTQTQEAFDEVSNIEVGLKGMIRISTTVDLSFIYLAKSISRFSANHPDLEFFIDTSPANLDLKTEGFDLAVRVGHLKDSSLYARKLNEHQLQLFATPQYIEKMGRPKSISDLYDHKLIAIDQFKSQNSVFAPTIAANNMSVLRQLTLHGAGIGLLSEIVVRPEKRSGELVQILPNLILPKVPVYLIFPHRKMPKRVMLFAQSILENKEPS